MDIETRPALERQSRINLLSDSDGETVLDIAALFSLLRRQFWVIISTATLTVVVALLVVTQLNPRYTADVLVQVDTATQQLTDSNAEAVAITTSTGFVQGQTDIVQSEAVLRRTIDDLDLLEQEAFSEQESIIDQIQSMVLGTNATDTDALDPVGRVVKRLRQNLDVSRIGLTFNLRVSFTSEDPGLAAEIANGIVDSYIAIQVEKKAESAESASSALALRVEQIAARLVQIEAEIAAFVAAGVGLQEGTLSEQELEELNNTIRSLANERRAVERSLVTARLANSSGNFSEVLASLRPHTDSSSPQPIVDLAAELEELLASRATASATEVNVVDQSLGRLSNNAGLILSDRLRELQRQETAAREQLRIAFGGSGDVAGVELFRLQSEADSAREMYRVALDLLNRAQIGSDIQVPDARAVSEAVPPIAPSFPPTRLFVALAGVLGLGLGVGLGFLRDYFYTGFLNEKQVERALNLPVISTIPLALASKWSPQEEVINKPLSPFSEALRRWQLAIDGAVPPGESLTVLVSSALPSEGKSTLTLSLARLYAAAGKKTVVIDCDLRKPSLAQLAGIATTQDDKVSLRDFLTMRSSKEIENKLIYKDNLSSAHLILGRPSPGTPSDTLLNSRRFAALLSKLQNSYEVIFIDSPPLVPVVDAQILLRYADVSTLVVKWAGTPPVDVEAAARDLQTPGSPQACVVLNMSRGRGGEYSMYNYSYGYGE